MEHKRLIKNIINAVWKSNKPKINVDNFIINFIGNNYPDLNYLEVNDKWESIRNKF